MKKKYTPKQRKKARSFSNKIYYYGKMAKKYEAKLGNIQADYTDIIRSMRSVSGTNVTFKDIRHLIRQYDNEDGDVARELYYAGCFEDDVYDTIDFRDFLIHEVGDRGLAEKLNSWAGLEPLEDWEAQFDADIIYESEDDKEVIETRSALARALKTKGDLEQAYKEWRKDVWNK